MIVTRCDFIHYIVCQLFVVLSRCPIGKRHLPVQASKLTLFLVPSSITDYIEQFYQYACKVIENGTGGN